MKKRATLLKVIELFFTLSRVKRFDLTELGNTFVLDEGGLMDTEIIAINEDGIETDGYGNELWEDINTDDLRYIVDEVLDALKKAEPELYKQQLVDEAIEQIKQDILDGDVEALDELLKFIPIENLIGYLPEKEKKYQNKLGSIKK